MKTATLVRPTTIAGTEVPGDVKQPTPERGSQRTAAFLLPLGLVLLGIAWRLWFLFQIGLPIDKDEAVTGVMAQRILLGERPVFFYGQDYMGIATAYVQAPIFALFGPGLPLRLVPIALSAALVWLIFQLANTLYGRGVAITSAAFIAISPVFLTMWSVRARYYMELVVIGTALLLLALRWRRGGAPWWLPPLFGLLAGVGVWMNQLILIYAAPLLILLVDRPTWRGTWQGAVAAGAAIIGGLPLLVDTLLRHNAMAQLLAGKALQFPNAYEGIPGYSAMLLGHVQTGLPLLLGFFSPVDPPINWELLIPYPMDARVVPISLSVGLVVVALWVVGSRTWRLLRPTAGGDASRLRAELALAALFLLTPLGFYAWVLSAFQASSPRYMLVLYSCTPLFVAFAALAIRAAFEGASELIGRSWLLGPTPRWIVGALAFVPVLWVTVSGNVDAHPEWSNKTTDAQIVNLVRYLAAHNIDTVFAPDWFAFPITYFSGGRIVASEPGCFHRIPADYARVARSPVGAWIDVDGGEGLIEAVSRTRATYVRDEFAGVVILHTVVPPVALPYCKN